MIRRLFWRLRWRLKQRLAGDSRYYGDGGTIHHSGWLDVETFHGTVVAVWFRCQPLPFHQREADSRRATEMEGMYGNEKQNCGFDLTGVEVREQRR
jgi:hypothetical protein